MTPHEVAAILERYAGKVMALPGVSRTRPHAFVEAKSELRGEMLAAARDLRTVTVTPTARPIIVAGTRDIGDRRVRVEVRRRA